jgi:hypothetical protein
MTMETNQKLFAFKLAAKEEAKQIDTDATGKWKAREGIAIAGCTRVRFGERAAGAFGQDSGIYC